AVVAGRMLLRHIRLQTIHYVGAGVCFLLAAVTAYELLT
ncbi:MAG: putative Ca2+/H+ antiporter, family, partial [Marmoricola sp.]|nr:putative Ca2+/H+ antiporter, family [Marmoricola sp.]